MFKGICNYFFLPALLLIAVSSCSTTRQSSNSNTHPDVLSGAWDVDFDVGSTTEHSTVNLKQDGTQFFGEGTDASNLSFIIVNGQINGSQLDFFKKYSGNQPTTIEYRGVLQQVSDPDYEGPYLSGTYFVASGSNRLSGKWRAQMPSKVKAAAAQAPVQPATPAPQPATPSVVEKPADLSGKWNAAYEYNFGVVHSTMFLEQNGNSIKGYGTDTDTTEKFVIEKGTYKYPSLLLVRVYKKKQGAKLDRSITFKAAVSMINAPDYRGPYLNGKTQGGGSWEAELANKSN